MRFICIMLTRGQRTFVANQLKNVMTKLVKRSNITNKSIYLKFVYYVI